MSILPSFYHYQQFLGASFILFLYIEIHMLIYYTTVFFSYFLNIFFIETQFTCNKFHCFKVYNVVVFSIFTKLHNHCHYLFPDHVYHPKRNPIVVNSHLPSLSSSSLAQPLIYFQSLDLGSLDTSHKWNQTICNLLLLSCI